MSDDVLTRDNDGNLAVRTVSSTGDNYVNPDDVYTRDSEGKLCVRTTGQGGGGGDQHNLGWYATQSALETAHPTATAGDWAIVGSTDTVWIWDTDTNAWKDSDQKGQVASVNGKTGAVIINASDVGGVPQYSTIPTASADNVGNIVQYIGSNGIYTKGFFYKCTSDGETPATYYWELVDVQPSRGIVDVEVNGASVVQGDTAVITCATIDDTSTSSLTATWSASKLNTTIGNIESLLAAI